MSPPTFGADRIVGHAQVDDRSCPRSSGLIAGSGPGDSVSAKLLRRATEVGGRGDVIGDLSRDGSGGQIHDGGALRVAAEHHLRGRAVQPPSA